MSDPLRKGLLAPYELHPEFDRGDMIWRMGSGERVMDRFCSQFCLLTPEEQDAFAREHPEPDHWLGFLSSIAGREIDGGRPNPGLIEVGPTLEIPGRIYSVDGAWSNRDALHNQVIAISGVLHRDEEGDSIRHWPLTKTSRSMAFEIMARNTVGYDPVVLSDAKSQRIIAVGTFQRYCDEDPTSWPDGVRGLAYGDWSILEMQIKIEQMYLHKHERIYV